MTTVWNHIQRKSLGETDPNVVDDCVGGSLPSEMFRADPRWEPSTKQIGAVMEQYCTRAVAEKSRSAFIFDET
jgi:hypothetical protein